MLRTTLAVCIATYKRTEGLHRLLESLRLQNFVHNEPPNWSIVVIDNDEEAPNEGLIKELSKEFPVSIIYGVQPKRGIASARNLAVELAGDVDYVAFIDDDEVADHDWLDTLLMGLIQYKADIVAGPVLPAFEVTPKEWILRGGFFDRPRHQTGEEIKLSGTGNMLVSQKWLCKWPGPFDERLNFIGGSDSLFFINAYRMGAKIIWVDEATVDEYNSPQRANLKWILKRNLRMGNTIVHVERISEEPIWKRIIRVIKCGGHLFGGILLLIPYGLFFGFAGIVKSLCIFCRGVGELIGKLSFQYEIYK